MLSPKLLEILRSWWRVSSSPATCPVGTLAKTLSNKRAKRPAASPASTNRLRRIPFDTDSLFICSNPAWMSELFNCCSVTAAWRPPPDTCGSPPPRCARPPARSTCSRVLYLLSPSPPRLTTSERPVRGSPEVVSGGCIPPLRRSLSGNAWRVDVHSATARHDRHRSVPDRGLGLNRTV